MNPIWRCFLESAEAVFATGSDEILNFGDAVSDLEAARNQTILVPLTHLGLIEASGDDAKAFLHNQFTSDINHLGVDLFGRLEPHERVGTGVFDAAPQGERAGRVSASRPGV